MSLFSKVGKQFEKTKQTFTSDEEAGYVCQSCEKPVAEDYEHCPHCGEGTVEAIEER